MLANTFVFHKMTKASLFFLISGNIKDNKKILKSNPMPDTLPLCADDELKDKKCSETQFFLPTLPFMWQPLLPGGAFSPTSQ